MPHALETPEASSFQEEHKRASDCAELLKIFLQLTDSGLSQEVSICAGGSVHGLTHSHTHRSDTRALTDTHTTDTRTHQFLQTPSAHALFPTDVHQMHTCTRTHSCTFTHMHTFSRTPAAHIFTLTRTQPRTPIHTRTRASATPTHALIHPHIHTHARRFSHTRDTGIVLGPVQLSCFKPLSFFHILPKDTPAGYTRTPSPLL